MWARPCGPRLSSVANAPAPNFLLFRCPPRGLGHAALDSDHAECIILVNMALVMSNVVFKWRMFGKVTRVLEKSLNFCVQKSGHLG